MMGTGTFRSTCDRMMRVSQVDAELMHRLGQLQAADCLFAYRMVVVQLLRELPAWQVQQYIVSVSGFAVSRTSWLLH